MNIQFDDFQHFPWNMTRIDSNDLNIKTPLEEAEATRLIIMRLVQLVEKQKLNIDFGTVR